MPVLCYAVLTKAVHGRTLISSSKFQVGSTCGLASQELFLSPSLWLVWCHLPAAGDIFFLFSSSVTLWTYADSSWMLCSIF